MTIPRLGWVSADVNCGYYPWAVEDGTPMRAAPDPDAKVVVEMPHATWFGRQSVRNPSGSDHPPPRQTVDGYVFGYSMQFHFSGWALLSALRENDYKDWAHGPAGADFEVGSQPCPKRKRNRWRIVRPLSGRIKHLGTGRPTYLRYSERGTAYWLLEKEAAVKELARGKEFTWVRVVDSEYAPKGAHGWVLTRNLK